MESNNEHIEHLLRLLLFGFYGGGGTFLPIILASGLAHLARLFKVEGCLLESGLFQNLAVSGSSLPGVSPICQTLAIIFLRVDY